MIRSFKCSETEKVFRGEVSRVLPPEIQSVARRKLRQLDEATRLEDLRHPPGNRLHDLSRDRVGQWAIRINDQWRVCFTWDHDAFDVEITDYH